MIRTYKTPFKSLELRLAQRVMMGVLKSTSRLQHNFNKLYEKSRGRHEQKAIQRFWKENKTTTMLKLDKERTSVLAM